MPFALTIRIAGPAEYDAARSAYEAWGYEGGILDSDVVYVAEREGTLVGIVRRTLEHDTTMLRGLWVAPSVRRTGIGTALLRTFVRDLGDKECLCLPFTPLIGFYGQVGFAPLPEADAPAFLVDRLAGYRAKRHDMLIMKRPSVALAVGAGGDAAARAANALSMVKWNTFLKPYAIVVPATYVYVVAIPALKAGGWSWASVTTPKALSQTLIGLGFFSLMGLVNMLWWYRHRRHVASGEFLRRQMAAVAELDRPGWVKRTVWRGVALGAAIGLFFGSGLSLIGGSFDYRVFLMSLPISIPGGIIGSFFARWSQQRAREALVEQLEEIE